MSDIKIVSPSSGTATFTLTTPSGTSTDRTLTLPDQTNGTILTTESTQSKMPLLYVTFARDTSGSSNTQFEFDTAYTPVKVDTHSYWSTSTHRYTPQVAGYYLVTGGATVQDWYWGGARPIKNYAGTAEAGVASWIRDEGNNHNDLPGWGHGIFSMNGSTDYISLVGIAYGGSSKNFDAGFLTVQFLRSL
jgi:hypothetical protein